MQNKKPQKIDGILSENRLCDWLDLPQVSGQGKSRTLSAWIRGGLRYVEKGDRRFFFENDVIEYLWTRYRKKWARDPSDCGD